MFNLPLPPVLSKSTVTFSELQPYSFFSLQTAGELPKGDVLMADPLFLLPLGNPSTFSAIFSSSPSVFFSPSKTKVPRGVKLIFTLEAQISLLSEQSTIPEEFVSHVADLKTILMKETIPSMPVAVVAHTNFPLYLNILEKLMKILVDASMICLTLALLRDPVSKEELFYQVHGRVLITSLSWLPLGKTFPHVPTMPSTPQLSPRSSILPAHANYHFSSINHENKFPYLSSLTALRLGYVSSHSATDLSKHYTTSPCLPEEFLECHS